LARKIAAAILMCAVMVLVAAVPLAAGVDHTIVKGPQGPRASAMTWTYEPAEYGIWSARMDNHGLRSLVIDVYDNTSGALDLMLHQRIRFAAYNAYPTGVIYSESLLMAGGRVYEITATPNGPRDSYVVVSDNWTLPPPLVASFTYSISGHAVDVDASTSTGAIAEYVWEWGDGTMGSGMTASHAYAMPGTYTIILTVADSIGATNSASQDVTLANNPPVAMFTATVSGHMASVDASASTDDWGIDSYNWNWGDESTGAGVTADHTYAAPGTYTITLTVADVKGLTDSATDDVILVDNPPMAAFTITVDGLTVSVNASASTDDWGVVSYSWNWGDGTTSSGVTATHTYAVAAAAASASAQTSGVIISAEPPPYYVAGYTYGPNGAILTDCVVKITNVRTGAWNLTASSATTGLYRFNLHSIAGDFIEGDLINITATKGTMIGWNESAVPTPMGSYMTMHVTLVETAAEPFQVTITLTVTDSKGQSATLVQTVMIYP